MGSPSFVLWSCRSLWSSQNILCSALPACYWAHHLLCQLCLARWSAIYTNFLASNKHLFLKLMDIHLLPTLCWAACHALKTLITEIDTLPSFLEFFFKVQNKSHWILSEYLQRLKVWGINISSVKSFGTNLCHQTHSRLIEPALPLDQWCKTVNQRIIYTGVSIMA